MDRLQLPSVNSTQYREALLRLNRMVLIGGPDDGVITPWQSSHFSFFDQKYNVLPLEESVIYTEDWIGLKTLQESGRLHIIERQHVRHYQWHRTNDVIDDVIMPYLD
uniref:palmitoyl-CoA hydrolase n=1 Tax=Anopheles coluzzii TaxID=1518534 RepID=A0A8W7Q150_ANOCL